RFALDVWYVDNKSFWLDITICLITIPAVLLSKNISAPGHVTMPAFKGSKP
ncbi:MAG: sugar transferase, partial [Cohaesibacter sp.]|nr:sugar transferase [Cohaesibacter sp.]